MVNEAVTILILYMLMPMAGVWVVDPEKKDQIGWVMVILTCTSFVGNIVPVVIDIFKQYKLKCTKCMNKRANDAKIKEIDEKA